jgi:fluoride exporter
LQGLLAVAAGGAAGSVARWLVVLGCGRLCGAGFPWGVFAVNVAGSFLMGLAVGLLARFSPASEATRLLLATGLLGGFTTFSSFSLDAVGLAERGDWAGFAFYVGGSVTLSILALVLGMRMVAWAM